MANKKEQTLSLSGFQKLAQTVETSRNATHWLTQCFECRPSSWPMRRSWWSCIGCIKSWCPSCSVVRCGCVRKGVMSRGINCNIVCIKSWCPSCSVVRCGCVRKGVTSRGNNCNIVCIESWCVRKGVTSRGNNCNIVCIKS